ncbi:hypothetical protein [Cupriavidus sp. SW-Y-13]|uniref:hypothetical protein n=1 Tax=Cupriavidus sp. SW-Y-13 TaxID=2653854 RepID=UPI001F1D1281|nr:hypothetical protein [Cupriavidus sp. SW-Y-13]
MNKANEAASADDGKMREILELLLTDDEDISARAVARLHPSIKAASSITRSESRRRLLAEYQQRQAEYRRWRGRAAKRPGADMAATLADKDLRITELEATVQLLTASTSQCYVPLVSWADSASGPDSTSSIVTPGQACKTWRPTRSGNRRDA